MQNKQPRTGDMVAIEGGYQFKALHKGPVVQRCWHRFKLQAAVAMANIEPGNIIYDVGCGSAILLEFLPNHYHFYTGFDGNPPALAFAQQQYGSEKNSFQYLQFDDLASLPAGSASRIFFLETIEHISILQAKQVLAQFARILIPGGRCIVTTPNRRSLWPAIEWTLDALRLVPKLAGDQHEQLFSKKELRNMALEAGLQVAEMRTFNGIAPFTGIISQKLAAVLHHLELRNNWFPGSLIGMALQKREIQDVRI